MNNVNLKFGALLNRGWAPLLQHAEYRVLMFAASSRVYDLIKPPLPILSVSHTRARTRTRARTHTQSEQFWRWSNDWLIRVFNFIKSNPLNWNTMDFLGHFSSPVSGWLRVYLKGFCAPSVKITPAHDTLDIIFWQASRIYGGLRPMAYYKIRNRRKYSAHLIILNWFTNL